MKDRKLFVEIRNGQRVTNRAATREEQLQSNHKRLNLGLIRDQIRHLEQEEQKLINECDHKVFYDIEGWPYDIRTCNGCGKHLGTI